MTNTSTSEKSMVSIIIPVFNEKDTIQEVFDRLVAVFKSFDRKFELIFIDDGSIDGCSEIMNAFPKTCPTAKIVRFSRNFGQQNALAAGFDHARGDILLFIDADLQTNPEEIPRLVNKMDEGYDVVAGYRKNRDESMLKRQLPSKLVNFVFKKVLKQPHQDMGCGFQAIRRSILDDVDRLSPMSTHRVIYAFWRGGKFAEIPIDYFPRAGGESKYNTLSLLHLFFDILMTFITRPYELVIFIVAGAVAGSIGFLGILAMLVASIFGVTVSPALWSLGTVLVFSGMISFVFGTINERLNRINHRINKTPIYAVSEVLENE
ncbi:glycosyltransferase family 2 protein [bacterium]|nr:glycosyltransferase family 2 protein [bacterium]